MDFKNLLTEDRAVSPVIGVILMVAITVILAAVIGTFVLGLGDQVSTTAPQAQFSFDYDQSGDTVTITHDGGDTIQSDQLTISNSNASVSDQTFAAGDVSSGSSQTIDGYSGDTIRVVWSSPSDDSTATIGRFEVP